MLVISTIYFAQMQEALDPQTGKAIKREVSDLKDAPRKVVIVYQGSNHVSPADSNNS